jgi:serine/threonine-protein kinase RsbW
VKKSLFYKIKSDKKYDELNFDIINRHLESLDYGDATIYKIILVVEEFITNILKYANNQGEISLALNFSANLITVNIADYGKMFDPLEIKTHALIDSVNDSKIGGLGIHIVKNIANSISYHRMGGNNIIKIIIANEKKTDKIIKNNQTTQEALIFEKFKAKSTANSPVASFI